MPNKIEFSNWYSKKKYTNNNECDYKLLMSQVITESDKVYPWI